MHEAATQLIFPQNFTDHYHNLISTCIDNSCSHNIRHHRAR